MIKLTNLEGKAFYVRQSAINLVREAFKGEYETPPGCVLLIGSQALAVRETVLQVMGMIGTPVG